MDSGSLDADSGSLGDGSGSLGAEMGSVGEGFADLLDGQTVIGEVVAVLWLAVTGGTSSSRAVMAARACSDGSVPSAAYTFDGAESDRCADRRSRRRRTAPDRISPARR